MTEYTVSWRIDIEADSHEEAAVKALKIHRDKNSIATVFDVYERAGTKYVEGGGKTVDCQVTFTGSSSVN